MKKSKENLREEEIRKEAELTQYSRWLGAAIEIGRGMGFSFYPRKGFLYAYPYIHGTDNDEMRVRFNTRFGGRANPHGNSWEWKVEGDDAVRIAVAIQEYCPSRRNTIDAFIDWKNASSRQERVDIAGQIKAIARTQTKEIDYQELIHDPQSLAGILDERGNVYARLSEGGTIYAHFVAASKNKHLLYSLKNSYRGDVFERQKADGKVGYVWETEELADIQYMYRLAINHLQFRSKIHPSLQARVLGI